MEDEPDAWPQPPAPGGGLAGSFADRLSAGSTNRREAATTWRMHGRDAPDDVDDEDEDENGDDDEAVRSASASVRPRPQASPQRKPGGRAGRDDRRPAPGPAMGPSWERPRRMDAYPTLKTRVGLPSFSVPPILVGVVAVVLAAVALFLLPTLLGWFDNQPDTGAGPTPTATASAQPSGTPAPPTPTPGPTQQIYIVQAGDTMSRIANRFGVPLQTLIDANRETIPNPDVLEIGQEVLIPSVAPTALPDAGASASP